MVNTTESVLAGIADQASTQYWGKYRGIVKNVDDDENMGRITCTVPSVYGDEVSPWALPAVPFAGQSHGFMLLPEPGDGVWVEFEAGDRSRPIWTGFWWARNEMPEEVSAERRVLVTSAGLKLVMDDGAKQIKLLHGDKAEITMSETSITLRFGSKSVVISDSDVSINGMSLKVM
ncbi:phage baseplate assembly protein V [Mycolicibacterium iranicum]|nr:phage baseplate assembly protein V [Mycolicibacterium iranicum]